MLIDRRGGGVSNVSVENFLSHSTEKLRKVTLLCFTKFLVSKKIIDKRRGGGGGGGREYHIFLSKFFCLTVPKFFVGQPFCPVFRKIYVSEEVCG